MLGLAAVVKDKGVNNVLLLLNLTSNGKLTLVAWRRTSFKVHLSREESQSFGKNLLVSQAATYRLRTRVRLRGRLLNWMARLENPALFYVHLIEQEYETWVFGRT